MGECTLQQLGFQDRIPERCADNAAARPANATRLAIIGAAPMERMRVPVARAETFEEAMHDAAVGDALLLFDGSDDGGVDGLDEPIGHRAIGVVYDPDAERWGNYVPTLVPRRYDAFLYIDETRAVDP